MANDDLVVDVREFASRVLQKEFPLDGVDGSKHARKQDGEPEEQDRAVLLKEDVPVGDEDLQLTKQPESQRQQEGDRYDEGVGNHMVLPKSRKQRLQGFSEKGIPFRERAESRKAPEALQKRAVCSAGKVRAKRLWRKRGRKSMRKDGSGARRLGRGCEAPTRDLLGLLVDSDSHLNAWSSRK